MKKQHLSMTIAAVLAASMGSAVYAQSADLSANAKVEVQQPSTSVTLQQGLKNTAQHVHDDVSHAGHAVVNGVASGAAYTKNTLKHAKDTATIKVKDLQAQGAADITESKNYVAEKKASAEAKLAAKKAQRDADKAAKSKAAAERRAAALAEVKAKQDKINAKLAQAKSAQVGANVSVNTTPVKAGVQVDAGVKAGAAKN